VVVADQFTGPPRTVTEIVPVEPVPRVRWPEVTVRLLAPPSPAPEGPESAPAGPGSAADDRTGPGFVPVASLALPPDPRIPARPCETAGTADVLMMIGTLVAVLLPGCPGIDGEAAAVA
jgi:hypothetical protein